MTVTCKCGGRYRRTDIVAEYSTKYHRTLGRDLDPLVAHWKCDGCGSKREQRKRLAKK